MKPTHFFIDGACSGNPGPGGWGMIEISPSHVTEFGGTASYTTNNRMELTAALAALKRLTPGQMGILHCDSKYVITGMSQWCLKWQKNGWLSSKGGPVANADLWVRLIEASQEKVLEWVHIKGHSNHPGNDRADEIAVACSIGKALKLFDGPREQYLSSILNTIF